MGAKREYWKKRYDFTCPTCGATLWAKPSMMMTEFGINSGTGSCLKCKTFLHLEIVPDIYGEEMKAEKWDNYLERQKEATA